MVTENTTSGSRKNVIAFIEDHPKAMVLLRVARGRAEATGAEWSAVFVETPQHGIAAHTQERALHLLTLAEQMGGKTIHVDAESIDKGITRILEKEKDNASLIVVGHVEAGNKWWPRPPALGSRVTRIARAMNLPLESVELSGQPYRRDWRERMHWLRATYLLYSLLTVCVASAAAFALQWILPPALFRVNNQNIGLLFMIACAFSAGRFGLLPGLRASAASFFIINYFFTFPFHVLTLSSVTDLLNIGIFFSAALLISLFASRTRDYAQKAARRELGTQALFTLYRIASVASSRAQALEKLHEKLTRMLEMEVAFFLPPALNPDTIEPAVPANLVLNEAGNSALALCWKEMKTTGLASPFNPGTHWRFEPMLAPGGEIGVFGVRPRARAQLDAWFGRLLTAIADQTASVIEHIELERSMESSRIRDEREKLRSMLLSSVSHDLKTPLASITGALNIYRSQGKRLSVEKQQALIDTALEESERLDNFITNIIDMTRLESGRVVFRQDWYDSQSFVREALKRIEPRLKNHTLNVNSFPEGIEVYKDLNMTEQALMHILDNACKYTPAGTSIDITCSTQGKQFVCEVRDHGNGIPPEKLERVFDKYARLQRQDSQVAGTGLGLSIAKVAMEAQGGLVTAANHPDGGAVFTIQLPQWRKADVSQYVA